MEWLVISIPFILGFIYYGFICIFALITTDWEKEKEITKLIEDK